MGASPAGQPFSAELLALQQCPKAGDGVQRCLEVVRRAQHGVALGAVTRPQRDADARPRVRERRGAYLPPRSVVLGVEARLTGAIERERRRLAARRRQRRGRPGGPAARLSHRYRAAERSGTGAQRSQQGIAQDQAIGSASEQRV